MTVHGSCLCGTVRYEVRTPFDRFLYCHCSRCRKATGTAHAANVVVAPDAFRWTAGEGNVVRYDLPTARSFATAFCKTCGAPMPHLTRSGLRVIVPAGSLDENPNAKPTCHAYWGSRANWHEGDPDLPKIDEAAF
ncbi:MAG TPA: GFA family protein [Rhizomicrobium sp.]|nr:GFA family protein [Rhizomicrobium sp.]